MKEGKKQRNKEGKKKRKKYRMKYRKKDGKIVKENTEDSKNERRKEIGNK